MSRWIVAVSLFAAALGLFAAFHFFAENRELRARLAAASAPAEPREIVRTLVVPAAPATPPETDASASEDPDAAPGPRPTEGRGGGERGRGIENFALMLSDPDARAAMLGRMKMGVDRTFGDLFVKLGLDEVQAETLRTLLAERQLVRMEAGLLARTATDDVERQEAEALREARTGSIEAGINAILGPEGGAILAEYQRSSSQRAVVKDIERRASYQGAALSPAQSDRLVDILRSAEQSTPAPASPGRREPLTQDHVARTLEHRTALNETVLAQAREVLSRPQLEALADKQIEELELLQQQLNFQLRNPELGRMGFDGGRGGRGPR